MTAGFVLARGPHTSFDLLSKEHLAEVPAAVRDVGDHSASGPSLDAERGRVVAFGSNTTDGGGVGATLNAEPSDWSTTE